MPAERTPADPTIASQAILSGDPAVGSSFRFHRPRGPLCGGGYCSQCEIETPEGRKLACQTPATESRRRHRDALRPLGRVAELFPPWFYERRFLRPRPLRRISLHLLRYLGAAGSLSGHEARTGIREFAELEAEVVVVGAGAAEPGAFVIDPAAGDVPLGIYPDRTIALLRGERMLAVRFERLVLHTGSYERLPPVPGNDLPGVIGLSAAETYAAAGALRPRLRVAAWAPPDQADRVRALVHRHGLELAWMGDRAPRAIQGRRRVRAVLTDRRVACELFVVAVRQPAIELALQAGATATLTTGELPILTVDDAPEWLTLTGEAALTSSGVPAVAASDAAIACACEDVRVSDLKACVGEGFTHPELVKRRTGAMTGPCQGKLCSAAVLSTLRELGVEATPTRARPLVNPVSLGELAADA
jgi:hypothetical protein